MIVKHTLYIGLNDKDSKTQKIGTLAAREIVNNLTTRIGYDSTISEAVGVYTHESGEIVIEPSLRVEILFADDKKTRQLCAQLKDALNQESIALQVENVDAQLI